MTARTRAAMKTQVTTLVDTTGSGGTSGSEVVSLLSDIADSAIFPGDALSALAEDGSAVKMTPVERTKLAGIEVNADVTDAVNVNAAGAVMNSDTSTAPMQFVIDEDTMASNSATKVPTQQSVKAYVDATVVAGGGYTDGQAQDAVGGILVDTSEIDFTYDSGTSITASLKPASVGIGRLATSGTASATTYLRGDGAWAVPEGSGGSGATNLSVTIDGVSVLIGSDTGDDATIPAATTSAAGVMSAADKTKLDGITPSGFTADDFVSAGTTVFGRADWVNRVNLLSALKDENGAIQIHPFAPGTIYWLASENEHETSDAVMATAETPFSVFIDQTDYSGNISAPVGVNYIHMLLLLNTGAESNVASVQVTINPTISSTGATGITQTAANIPVASDHTGGIVDWALVAFGASPNAAAIRAGTGASETGSLSVFDGAETVALSSLLDGTNYRFAAVYNTETDRSGLDSAPIYVDFTTAQAVAAAPQMAIAPANGGAAFTNSKAVAIGATSATDVILVVLGVQEGGGFGSTFTITPPSNFTLVGSFQALSQSFGVYKWNGTGTRPNNSSVTFTSTLTDWTYAMPLVISGGDASGIVFAADTEQSGSGTMTGVTTTDLGMTPGSTDLAIYIWVEGADKILAAAAPTDFAGTAPATYPASSGFVQVSPRDNFWVHWGVHGTFQAPAITPPSFDTVCNVAIVIPGA